MRSLVGLGFSVGTSGVAGEIMGSIQWILRALQLGLVSTEALRGQREDLRVPQTQVVSTPERLAFAPFLFFRPVDL